MTHWVALAAIAVLTWLFRFEVSTAQTDNYALAYRLDRWTGEIAVCVAFNCGPSEPRSPGQ